MTQAAWPVSQFWIVYVTCPIAESCLIRGPLSGEVLGAILATEPDRPSTVSHVAPRLCDGPAWRLNDVYTVSRVAPS